MGGKSAGQAVLLAPHGEVRLRYSRIIANKLAVSPVRDVLQEAVFLALGAGFQGEGDMPEVTRPEAQAGGEESDRRKFLKAAGKFAVVVPPAMTFLLSTSMTASASSGSSGGPALSGGKGGTSRRSRSRRRRHGRS